MPAPIFSAGSIPLGGAPAVPDMAGALQGWTQTLSFERLTKTVQGFQVMESTTPVSFSGVVQPLSATQLMLKPEGQRAWRWFQIHAWPGCPLNVDDVILYKGMATRVMALTDYAEYGYIEYHCCQDWTGSEPVVITGP